MYNDIDNYFLHNDLNLSIIEELIFSINPPKSGKWIAEIRTHKKYISKTFLKKANASNWAKEIEYK